MHYIYEYLQGKLTGLLSTDRFWMELKMLGIALVIFLFFVVLRKIFSSYVYPWIMKMAEKTEIELDEKIWDAFEKPLNALFLILGVFFALRYLPLSAEFDLMLTKFFRSALIIIVTWGFYSLSGSHSSLAEELRTRLNLDYTIIQFFSKVARILIVIIAVLVLAEEWDYDVNGLIAGLGLGGLAFALAAKDALANIFGGVVIILDKPFAVGDWIKTPSIEGTVEEISFRSTKIRAFDQALITMPNSTLANEPITNFSRMGKRRVRFYLGVTYATPPEKIKRIVDKIRALLQNHEGVHPETIVVYFEQFNESSLDILVYFFTNSTDLAEHLAIRHDINLEIMNILAEEGVSIAFPSRSIYVENLADQMREFKKISYEK